MDKKPLPVRIAELSLAVAAPFFFIPTAIELTDTSMGWLRPFLIFDAFVLSAAAWIVAGHRILDFYRGLRSN